MVFTFLTIFSCKKEKTNENDIIKKIKLIQEKAKQTTSDSVFVYLNQTKQFFDAVNNIPDSLKAENYYLLGNYYSKIKNPKLAIKHYNQAINYSSNIINSEREKGYHKQLAFTYKINGDYLNSLSILNKLEKGIESKSDYNSLAEINTQKQSIYKLLKNYKKSIKFNRKAVKYFAKAKDTSKLVNSLILQANLNYYNFKNKKEAYRLLDSILTINIKSNNFKNILKNQVYQSYGIFNYYDTNFKESYKNYHQALSYLKNPKTKIDSIGLANSYANISEVCIELKEYELSKKYNDSVDDLMTVLNANLKNFHLQNKLRLSYETQKNFNEVSSNLNTLNRSMNKNYEKRISNELTALKEANKKEKELLVTNQKVTLHNSKLKNKQILLFSVLGFLVLSTFIGILYYRQRKLGFQKEEIFMQQRLFRAQMNPHFTSNILYTIQDLILENKEKANKYLIKFSRLLRLNLENSMQNYTLIEKEIEVLTKYLDLQKLRFPDKFNYQINTHDLDVDLLSIPPMLMQPFVENAIEHGFKNIDYQGLITINLSEKNNFIFCEIIDNGLGLKNTNDKKEHNSASTKLIKKLLKNMTNQEVTIQDNTDKNGTIVWFNIPFKEI